MGQNPRGVRRGWHSYMLGPHSDAEQARRDPAQERPGAQLLEGPRKRDRLAAAEHTDDHSILYKQLQALGDAGRKFAPSLDLV